MDFAKGYEPMDEIIRTKTFTSRLNHEKTLPYKKRLFSDFLDQFEWQEPKQQFERPVTRSRGKQSSTLSPPNTKNLKKVPYALMNVSELRELLVQKDDLVEDLRMCLIRNEKEIPMLQNRMSKFDLSVEEQRNLIIDLLPMLTENQITLMTKQKKRVNWTCDEISIGFALSFFSRRAYMYLIYQLQYALPAIRTLQLWSQNMDIGPGILKDSFTVLKAMRNSLTEGEAQCGNFWYGYMVRRELELMKILNFSVFLSFDEMSCKSRYEYNKTLDCIMGPHSQIQTAMARGLFSKFKQPIYVDFDKKMTEELLNSFIKLLHSIKFNVVGIVSDNGGGNVGLWTECSVNFERNYIIHSETGEKIFIFSDAPHLLKLLRNWLIDGGFLLSDGTELNQYWIRTLIESNTEISPLFKLSIKHLIVQGPERQNVRLASQLFSHSVAQSLRRHFPNKEVVQKLADFIGLVNNWFDIMNSYSLNGIGYKKPYGLDLDEQNRVLDNMYSTIKSMKCFNKKKELQNSLQIFQKGILMSITSIKDLQKAMTKIFGFGYLLTHRCNQDCLENLYCQVRGRNGPDEHPTPVDCLYRIKSIILGKNPGLSVELHSNTIEQDPEEYVSAKFMKHLSRDGYTSAIVEQLYDQGRELGNIGFLENCDVTDEVQNEPDNLAEELIEDYSNDQNDQLFVDDSKDIRGTCIHLEIEILNDKYIAGWIAWKFKRSYPDFSQSRRPTLPSHLVDHTYSKRSEIYLSSWIDVISHGGLTKPNDEVLQWVRRMETVFIDIHGEEFADRVSVKKSLINEIVLRCPEVLKEVIDLFARCRIHMRCKFLIRNARLAVPLETIEGEVNDPIATRSRPGWQVYGSTKENYRGFLNVHRVDKRPCQEKDNDLHTRVKEHFTVENFGVVANSANWDSKENVKALKMMEENTIRKCDRFETKLLWKINE
ncbi:Transposable element P transposase [Pseudolycoriella hygida]|uniref:Transposable element P transposase n=1 Tax=Pseudolycoriella hygida TaxID=35572 RepID=A0A9Q0MXE6_9DIPT|nr:Transposable element P transposase [Pseudolycoriella hygida]